MTCLGGPPCPPESLAFQLFFFFSFFPVLFPQFFQFPKRFLEEMPLRNHSAWLQHWLPNERPLTDADSGPQKCVFWQMQVLVTTHCKYLCFVTKPVFFWGVYIYIHIHIHMFSSCFSFRYPFGLLFSGDQGAPSPHFWVFSESPNAPASAGRWKSPSPRSSASRRRT